MTPKTGSRKTAAPVVTQEPQLAWGWRDPSPPNLSLSSLLENNGTPLPQRSMKELISFLEEAFLGTDQLELEEVECWMEEPKI